jgi:hypothetical protein
MRDIGCLLECRFQRHSTETAAACTLIGFSGRIAGIIHVRPHRRPQLQPVCGGFGLALFAEIALVPEPPAGNPTEQVRQDLPLVDVRCGQGEVDDSCGAVDREVPLEAVIVSWTPGVGQGGEPFRLGPGLLGCHAATAGGIAASPDPTGAAKYISSGVR